MTVTALFNNGMKAMAASYAQMQTTSHNIANANVAGYSRQSVELATAKGQFTGAGFFGKGVDVVTVSRTHNEFLLHESDAAQALASMDGTKLTQLKQLELVFKAGEQGLGHAAGSFLNSMVELASHPSDAATRQVVLARAQELTTRFNHAGEQLDSLQRGLTAELQSTVSEVNSLASNIATINGKIAAVTSLGQPPNDLLDERDRLVSKLNSFVQVSTIPAEDGSLSVFIGGGQRLVLGPQAQTLRLLTDQDDPSRAAIGFTEGNIDRQIDDASLGGGSIVGLLRFQNADLVAGRNLVGRLAAAVAGATNATQKLGVNLYTPPGSVPSEPFFSVGDPRAVPAKANAKDGAGNYLATITLTVTDAAQLLPNDYALRRDPAGVPGMYEVKRLPDGLVRTVADGAVLDGFRIDIGSPVPAANDHFLLQPVGRAANGMKLLLDDPRDIAAASPLVASAIPLAAGTVAIESMRMLTTPPNPTDNVRITFTSNNGDYTWELVDPISNAVLSTATGTWLPGGSIPTPPTDMNGFELKLVGVPRSGDVLMVQPTDPAHIPQNNGNALALAALREAQIAGGATATDAYASAMADVGVRVQGSAISSQISQAIASQANDARANSSGVSLDEEAARLIQYQQSYQAAAKVLQVAQSVFDTLLATANR